VEISDGFLVATCQERLDRRNTKTIIRRKKKEGLNPIRTAFGKAANVVNVASYSTMEHDPVAFKQVNKGLRVCQFLKNCILSSLSFTGGQQGWECRMDYHQSLRK